MTCGSKQKSLGFTLIELLIVCALIGVLQTVAVISYREYLERVDIALAIIDMRRIEKRITLFNMETGKYPDSLAQISAEMTDPWGAPYVYLNIATVKGKGPLRKDKNLVPINSDYDLYSTGKDGLTVAPLTAPKSHDDIVRANNGSFVGLGSDF